MVVYAGGDVKVNADELPEGRVLPKRLSIRLASKTRSGQEG